MSFPPSLEGELIPFIEATFASKITPAIRMLMELRAAALELRADSEYVERLLNDSLDKLRRGDAPRANMNSRRTAASRRAFGERQRAS